MHTVLISALFETAVANTVFITREHHFLAVPIHDRFIILVLSGLVCGDLTPTAALVLGEAEPGVPGNKTSSEAFFCAPVSRRIWYVASS